MTLVRALVPRLRRPRSGGQLLLVGLAAPLLAVALACGSDGDEAASDEAGETVAAAGGGVTTATPTASPATATELSGEDLAVAVWGEQTCALTRAFAVDFLASGDPRDPAELSLEERKQRADAMFPPQLDTVTVALGQLELIEAPERTAELHALLRQTFEDLLRALGDQQLIIEASSSNEEIAFSNREVNDLLNLALRRASLLQNAGYC